MTVKRETKVRLAGPDDMANIVEWSQAHLESADKLSYPTLRILASENGKLLQYGFVHGVAMLESIAPNPGASQTSLKFGLKALMDAIVNMVKGVGIKELYVMTGPDDEKLERLAEHYGFDKVPYSVWRLKV